MVYAIIFVPVAVAIIYSAVLALWLKKQPAGSANMVEIEQSRKDRWRI